MVWKWILAGVLIPGVLWAGHYKQAIQLERGWNLVAWYVELPDPTEWDPRWMNDVFMHWNEQTEEYDYFYWLNPLLESPDPDVGDRVGIYNSSPYENMYPEDGTSGWTWSMNQAYHIYRDRFDQNSPAHFWEYTNQPHSQTGTMTIDPEDDWDNFLAPSSPPNFWWFLAYPLRMQQKIDVDDNGWSDNPTISYLENWASNRLVVLKDDDEHQYVPGHPHITNLYYLTPGKGYFAGFANGDPVPYCPGFGGEVEPALLPGGGSKGSVSADTQIASEPAAHFTYIRRTHWWYPIVIDTASVGEIFPETGDEIAVFDGDLCVGAAAYPDSFPVILAAWKDDIATPGVVDGYRDGNEMTFKWYDQSENAEITFTPPPGTYSMEDDRIAPTHSGFGYGFYALRSLTDGVGAVSQLPQEFVLGQNYPNPFNATTVIPLELPQHSRVRIELFNLRGQNLGVIYEGIQQAGWPKIRYNASRLASGVYFYRLTAEGLERGGHLQSVGKMLVLK